MGQRGFPDFCSYSSLQTPHNKTAPVAKVANKGKKNNCIVLLIMIIINDSCF